MQRRPPQTSGDCSISPVSAVRCYHHSPIHLKVLRVSPNYRAKRTHTKNQSLFPEKFFPRNARCKSSTDTIARPSFLCACGQRLCSSRSSRCLRSCTDSHTASILPLLSHLGSWRDGETTCRISARPRVIRSRSPTTGLSRLSHFLLLCFPVCLSAFLCVLLPAIPVCFSPAPFLCTAAREKYACGSSSIFHNIFTLVDRCNTNTRRASRSTHPPFFPLLAEAVSSAKQVKSLHFSPFIPHPLFPNSLPRLRLRSQSETRPSVFSSPFQSRTSATSPKRHLPASAELFAALSPRSLLLSRPSTQSRGTSYIWEFAIKNPPLEQHLRIQKDPILKQEFILSRKRYCFCPAPFPAFPLLHRHTGDLAEKNNSSPQVSLATSQVLHLHAAAASCLHYGQRHTRRGLNENITGAPANPWLKNISSACETNTAGGKRRRGRISSIAANTHNNLICNGTLPESHDSSSNKTPPATTTHSCSSSRSPATSTGRCISTSITSSKKTTASKGGRGSSSSIGSSSSKSSIGSSKSSIGSSNSSIGSSRSSIGSSSSSSIGSSSQSSGGAGSSDRGRFCIEDATKKLASRLPNTSACRQTSSKCLSGSDEGTADAVTGVNSRRCSPALPTVYRSPSPSSGGRTVAAALYSSGSDYGAHSSTGVWDEGGAGHCSSSSSYDDGRSTRSSSNTSTDSASTAAGPRPRGGNERETSSAGRRTGCSSRTHCEGINSRSSCSILAAKDSGSWTGEGLDSRGVDRSRNSSSSGQRIQVSSSSGDTSSSKHAKVTSSGGDTSTCEGEKKNSSIPRGGSTSSCLRLSALPLYLCCDLQQVQQKCCAAASVAKQVMAAVWSSWKNLPGKKEAKRSIFLSSRRYIGKLSEEFFLLHLSSVAARLQMWFSIKGGEKSWWWTQQQQLIHGRSREATAAAAVPVAAEAAAAATGASVRAAVAEAAAAARLATATAVSTARGMSSMVAAAVVSAARKALRATRTVMGGAGEDLLSQLQWIPLLLLPPPLPPVGQLLQGVLLLSFVADSFVFKGGLLEYLAFDMRRESFLRSGNSSRNGCDFSSVRNNNYRQGTSPRGKDGFCRPSSFLAFCMRAAAAGLVHSNWLHLLVNLLGIRQLLPMCERLCYDALCSSRPVMGSSAGGCFSENSAAAVSPVSSGVFSKGWSWFWKPPAAEESAAAAPAAALAASAASSVAAAARRCLVIGSSGTAAEEKQRKGLEWLLPKKLYVLHGPYGREGWWARAIVLMLFISGCAAGNITSFYLRQWWRRLELSVEQQQRQQALKRKLWGGNLPEADECEGDELFEDAEAGGGGGFAYSGADAAASSWASSSSSHRGASSVAAAAASRRDDSSASTAFQQNDDAAVAEAQAAAEFFQSFGEGGPVHRRGSSREGREGDGTNCAAAAAGTDDTGGLLQQSTFQKKKKEVPNREEKAWERQLRLQKMRQTQKRRALCSEETRDRSNSRGGSSRRHAMRDARASREAWQRFLRGESSSSLGGKEGTEADVGWEDRREEDDEGIGEEELDEEILDETAAVADDREWCVRTVGCSAGLYSLLGLLVGSARIGGATKKSIVKQIFKKIITEFFMPTGVDEPGHLGGFIFGYIAANLLRW